MFDRAKILFSAGGNFKGVGNEPIGIRTIQAVGFIKKIKIGQMDVIEHNIVGPFDLGNAVDGERGGLVNGDKKIEENDRENHAVNERCSEIVLWAHRQEPAKYAGFERAVFIFNSALELYPLALDVIKQGMFLFMKRIA